MSPRRLPLLIPILFTLALSACGGGEDADVSGSEPSGAGAQAQSAGDGGLAHIHGLGVSEDRLLIATHTGLWVAPEGQIKARRFGNSTQDIMGFSVLDEDRFIGSGHPDPAQDLPPNLGLIESRDAGKSWRGISLGGEADFHVLESSGPRVYGFDGTQSRLMVSSDGGRSWEQRRPPAAMFSLAIDPASSKRVVTSTEGGLFSSEDAGKSFRPLVVRQELAGLLAWPAEDRLFLVDGSGQVKRSSDGGAQWQPVGSIDGQPAAFIAHGDDLYAALANGSVKRSSDGGKLWTVRAKP